MGIWKIAEDGPQKVRETHIKKEKLLEEQLEDWIVRDPTLLGEPLLVVGRQILFPDVKDRLDILALDLQGNAVIVELKRGKLKDPVDMQAMRYASYISRWRFEDFENQARNFYGKVGDPDFSFNDMYESFCEQAGVDEIPDLNQDQRLIIVGSSVREKLGSVALWLRDHRVDVTVIQMQAFKDGDSIFLQPEVIVPVKVSKFAGTGGAGDGDSRPWVTDGRLWHLDKRCSQKTKSMLLQLDEIIQANFDVDGLHWNQKHFVSYRIAIYNWLTVRTSSSTLRLSFLVRARSFKAEDLATTLGVEEFDKEMPLSKKLGLPSSVFVMSMTENTARVVIRVKEDFDLASEAFLKFMKEAHKAFPK